jgi:hypothetical protein
MLIKYVCCVVLLSETVKRQISPVLSGFVYTLANTCILL